MPTIEVLDPPVAKARPRAVRTKDGKVRMFTERKTELAEERIRKAWHEAGHGVQPGPVYLRLVVTVTRPKGHYGARGRLLPSAPRSPVVQPDWDNYSKTACDALNGTAFRDDAEIVEASVTKRYALEGEGAGWLITVRGNHGADGQTLEY
jgi:Holliday junction resolvase RusA-like endonuclease